MHGIDYFLFIHFLFNVGIAYDDSSKPSIVCLTDLLDKSYF